MLKVRPIENFLWESTKAVKSPRECSDKSC